MNDERIEELTAEIAAVEARRAHLAEQARATEAGDTDVKEKQDPDGTVTAVEKTHKVSHNHAVAYWKEVRETEKRLDDLRAELRRLRAGGAGEAMNVFIHHDAPPEEEGAA
jgi:chromosome segregation ATPase